MVKRAIDACVGEAGGSNAGWQVERVARPGPAPAPDEAGAALRKDHFAAGCFSS